jgi:hypothetical protein
MEAIGPAASGIIRSREKQDKHFTHLSGRKHDKKKSETFTWHQVVTITANQECVVSIPKLTTSQNKHKHTRFVSKKHMKHPLYCCLDALPDFVRMRVHYKCSTFDGVCLERKS